MSLEPFAADIHRVVSAMNKADLRLIGQAIINALNGCDQQDGVTVTDVASQLGLPGCHQVVIDKSVRQIGTLSIYTTALPSKHGFVVIYVKDGQNLSGAAEIAEVKRIYWREHDLRQGGKNG